MIGCEIHYQTGLLYHAEWPAVEEHNTPTELGDGFGDLTSLFSNKSWGLWRVSVVCGNCRVSTDRQCAWSWRCWGDDARVSYVRERQSYTRPGRRGWTHCLTQAHAQDATATLQQRHTLLYPSTQGNSRVPNTLRFNFSGLKISNEFYFLGVLTTYITLSGVCPLKIKALEGKPECPLLDSTLYRYLYLKTETSFTMIKINYNKALKWRFLPIRSWPWNWRGSRQEADRAME